MREGQFPDGSRTLRAKIDMASPNLNLRDPVMYRIRREHHDRTGDKWCIYPTYDWAHGQSTRSRHHPLALHARVRGHRPLYDWFLEQIGLTRRPRQIEFARLNLTYTVMSSGCSTRWSRRLVSDGTTRACPPSRSRRRGYTPESIRLFCDRIGVAKADSTVGWSSGEHAARDAERLRPQGPLRPPAAAGGGGELGRGQGRRDRRAFQQDVPRQARANCRSRASSSSSGTTSWKLQ